MLALFQIPKLPEPTPSLCFQGFPVVQQLLPLPRLMTRQLLGSAGNPAYLQSPGIARQVAIQPASDVPRVELVGFHSLVPSSSFTGDITRHSTSLSWSHRASSNP